MHLVLDNAATHKTKLIHDWLLKRPRWHLHFTPTSCLLGLKPRRGLVRAADAAPASTRRVRDHGRSEAAIHAYIDQTNAEPKPFVWTKSADAILASIKRFCQRTSNSDH